MRSIRLSLMGYFLGLLALALGTASLLAYQTSYLTLQDKKTATEELIKKQYDDTCAQERQRLDQQLLNQAERLAQLVEFRYEFGQQREHRQIAMYAGLLTALPSPTVNGDAQVFVWGSLSAPLPRRPGLPRDPVGDLFRRNPQIKLNGDDEQLKQLTSIGGQTAEYFQIDASWGGTVHSEKLGQRSLSSLDVATYRPNDLWAHDFDNVDMTPENVTLRRVILKFPAGMGGPPRPPGGGRPGPPPPGGVALSMDFSHGKPLYIQCAAPTSVMDPKLQDAADSRDEGLAKVETETAASLAALRNRLLGMSLLTFVVIITGTWWLVRFGLLPLNRLSVAVSKVSEKDFTLQFDEPRLPIELQPIHDRLVATLEQLKRAFAREKQATADISHELRTPLAALLTTMELALRKTRSAEEYREMFQDCLLSAQHMNQIVERLLALARLDAGVDHLRPKPVEVGKLADQCAAMVRPLAEARGLNLTVLRRGEAAATVDPDKVREIMINLLHNAIQYNRPNGSITLTVSRPEDKLEFSVSDTGIGIAPEKQDQIFERFFRADPSRGAEGAHAGLGLAIVKGYVDLMGGTLDVESEVDHGSTFRIRLPMSA